MTQRHNRYVLRYLLFFISIFIMALGIALTTRANLGTTPITALPYVRDGLGIAIVDSLLPWEQFNGVVTRPFEPRIDVPIAILTSNDRPLSASHELMRDCLRAACRTLNRPSGA